MLQQLNQPVTFEAFYTASGVGKTGLTVTVDVYGPTGSLVVSGGGASETGGGFYRYAFSATSTAGDYRAVFKTADSTVDQKHIPSLWVVGNAVTQTIQSAADRAYFAQGGNYNVMSDNTPLTGGGQLTLFGSPNDFPYGFYLIVLDGLYAGEAREITGAGNDGAGNSVVQVSPAFPAKLADGTALILAPPATYAVLAPLTQRLTAARAMNLENLDAAISSVASTTLVQSVGTAASAAQTAAEAVNTKLTTQRAANLDNLDVAVSSVASGDGLSGPNSVAISFEDADSAAVGGVFFRIEGLGGAVAASNGTITIGLDAGSYTLNARPQNGVIFPSTSFTVSADDQVTNVTVTGTAVALPEPPDSASTCTVTLQLANAQGQEQGYLTLVELPKLLSSGWVVGQKSTATVNESGALVWTDVPCGVKIQVSVPAAKINKTAVIPDSATVFAVN